MKKIISILAMVVFVVLLCSCGTTMQTEDELNNSDTSISMFILLEDNTNLGYCIVYHRETKVMYAISSGYYNCGNFTVMLNPDGTPMTYEKYTEEK